MQVALGKANDDPLSTLALLAMLREAVEMSVMCTLLDKIPNKHCSTSTACFIFFMQVALSKANDDPLSTLALLAVLGEAVEVSSAHCTIKTSCLTSTV